MTISEANLPKPLAQLYSYWQSKRGDRLMPSRADINPVEMQAFLSHTMLIDVLADQGDNPRFRLRLVGTHAVGAYGAEITGKYNDEIDLGDQREKVIAACLESVYSKAPVFLSGSIVKQPENETITYERLGVPLSSNGESVDMILVAVKLQRKQCGSVPG